jgi:DNA polymerase-3 subunit epsilon
VKLYPDGKETEWSTLVNPKMLIPKEASDVHHITNEMVDDKEPFSFYAPKLLQGFKDCDFCGYNLKFDIGFLTSEFKRLGVVFTPGKVVDGFRIFQRCEPRNLQAAMKFYCDEEFGEAHDALADSKAVLKVIKAQLERYPGLPRSVDELHALIFETVSSGHVDAGGKIAWRHGIAVLNFGKHSGVALQDVPKPYLKWLADSDFPPDVKLIAQDAVNGVYPAKS